MAHGLRRTIIGVACTGTSQKVRKVLNSSEAHKVHGFFCVTLPENKVTLMQNVRNINKFYRQTGSYSVITPSSAFSELDELCAYGVNLVAEETLISYKDFKHIVEMVCSNYGEKEESIRIDESRLGWYYQQILKLGFMLDRSLVHSVTLIDADTCLLSSIDWFDSSHSRLFVTVYEKQREYWETLCNVFGPKIRFEDWKSTTCQIMSLTQEESFELRLELEKRFSRAESESTYEWISRIVTRSIVETHGYIGGSLISEQDLIGYFLRYRYRTRYKQLRFARYGITGKFSKLQMILLKALGFKHITYEHWQIEKGQRFMKWRTFACILREYHAKAKAFKKGAR
jgi:hypothetical protein